jgi:hypothetical protein
MSSDRDLERLLREGWKDVPEPDAAVTRDARRHALSAARRRPRRRMRVAALVGTAVVVAIGLGVGIGTFVAPSGTAARGPIGLGFLPLAGWSALQTATPGVPDQPAVAMAANIPFADDDVVNGLAEPSALPYSTLLTLPPHGVVLVGTFVEARGQPWSSTRYHEQRLPLRVQDATPIEYGTQVRPEEPLGQYQLRALVNGYHVDLQIYTGTPRLSSELAAEVQRQLDQLVVQRVPEAVRAPSGRRPATTRAGAAPSVLDRTYACAPALIGGVRQIDTRAYRRSGRRGASWDRPAFADVSTTVSGAAATAVDDELAWVTSGRPSADATVITTLPGFAFPMQSWGTLAFNARRCGPSSAKVALGRRGLRGGPVGALDDRWDCAAGRSILVRIRAVTAAPARLTTYRGFHRTTVPVQEASLAVQAATGRRLVFSQVLESGKALLFTSPTCFPD